MSSMIAVIVPPCNETGSIVPVIEWLQDLRGRLPDRGLELRLIVIADGSTDHTAVKARIAGADQLVSHRRNMGLGALVRTGLSIARDLGADICVKFDVDLQHDPADIVKLIDPILRGQADLVYHGPSSNVEYKMPLVRRWDRVFTRLMRRLIGWPVVDCQPGSSSQEYVCVFEIPGDYDHTPHVLLDTFLKGMRLPQAFQLTCPPCSPLGDPVRIPT